MIHIDPIPFQCIRCICPWTHMWLFQKYWWNIIRIATLRIRVWWRWCEIKKTNAISRIWSSGDMISTFRWSVRSYCTIYPIFCNQLHCHCPIIWANWSWFWLSNFLFVRLYNFISFWNNLAWRVDDKLEINISLSAFIHVSLLFTL